MERGKLSDIHKLPMNLFSARVSDTKLLWSLVHSEHLHVEGYYGVMEQSAPTIVGKLNAIRKEQLDETYKTRAFEI